MERSEPPLGGLRILLTRPSGIGDQLVHELERLGATVDKRPTIALSAPGDPAPVDRALTELPAFDWVVFTSPSGVRFFRSALERNSFGIDRVGARLAAIGEGTRRALHEIGLSPTLVATDSRSEGLAQAAEGEIRRGDRVLLVRPEVARSVLPEALREIGAQVDSVAFYRNESAPGVRALARDVTAGRYDLAVFTSPSTLRRLLEAAGERRDALEKALSGIDCVAIGEVTAGALRQAGLTPGAVAGRPTDEGLLLAIRSLFPD